MSEQEDIQREREKLELEKSRLDLERERFAFEREKQAASTLPNPSPRIGGRRTISIGMWIIGALLVVSCLLPWVNFRGGYNWGIAGKGSMFLGDASGTNFWQGQLCVLLVIGAFVARYLKQRLIAGLFALAMPLLTIHFLLHIKGMFDFSQSVSVMGYTASNYFRAEPNIGLFAFILLSIPFFVLAALRWDAFIQVQPNAMQAAGTVPAAPQASVQIPWLLLLMSFVHLCLVGCVIALFSSSTRKYIPYVLLFSVGQLAISRIKNWSRSTFWATIMVAFAAFAWWLRWLSNYYRPLSALGRDTGSGITHWALAFADAMVVAMPFIAAVLALAVVRVSWLDRIGGKPSVLAQWGTGSSWKHAIQACAVIVAFPLIASAFDAAKLNIPTSKERDRSVSLVRGVVTDSWVAFQDEDLSMPTPFRLDQSHEGRPSPILITDYGVVNVIVTLLWNNRDQAVSAVRFNANDEILPDTLVFDNRTNRYFLTDLQDDIIGVHLAFPDGSAESDRIAISFPACKQALFNRRRSMVASLEHKFRRHCSYLSPPGLQFVPGEPLAIDPSSVAHAAIAMQVLLPQDTIGMLSYRYEAVSSPKWVGLTDTTITLDHEFLFTFQSKDNREEQSSQRSYKSVFDTSGVLISSKETSRVQKAIAPVLGDSSYSYMADGIFVAATCEDDCYVTFKVIERSIPIEKTFLYEVVQQKVPLMIGEGVGDRTNRDLVGQKFVLMLKHSAATNQIEDSEATNPPLDVVYLVYTP